MKKIKVSGNLLDRQQATDRNWSDGSRAIQKGLPLGSSYQPDQEYKGRPESIESVFYMYRITGDPKWQDYGWRMFTSWVKHSLTRYFRSLNSFLPLSLV